MDKEFVKERINYIRTSNKISARNLSLELGMSSEYINQLETGRLTPSRDFLFSFCEYFKISVSEFFNEDVKYPLELKQIVKALNTLDKQQVDCIARLIGLMNRK